jgi:hypothetical protein
VVNAAGHAFISYVREDSHDVDRLQRTLEAAGVSVWRDTADLWPGEDWRVRIRRAITDNALVFVACFSSRSIARKKTYQNEELLLAIEQLRLRRPDDSWLIPVRFDNCEIPDLEIGGGRTLASIQRVDLFGDYRDVGIARLVAAVLRILGHRSDLSLQSELVREDSEGRTFSVPSTSGSLETSAEIGHTYRHLGIAVTLIAVASSFSVTLSAGKYQSGSGYETYEDVPAGNGAKFVTVNTRVLNDSTTSIDLTCGYPIGNHLVDDRSRKFDSIDRLYRIRGNPECNDNLQPGFASDMTWIYRVPLDAVISAFEFEDLTDFTGDRTAKPTIIPLVVPNP